MSPTTTHGLKSRPAAECEEADEGSNCPLTQSAASDSQMKQKLFHVKECQTKWKKSFRDEDLHENRK